MTLTFIHFKYFIQVFSFVSSSYLKKFATEIMYSGFVELVENIMVIFWLGCLFLLDPFHDINQNLLLIVRGKRLT